MERAKKSIVLRLSEADAEAFKLAAQHAGLTLSGWLRMVAKAAARRSQMEHEPNANVQNTNRVLQSKPKS